MKKIIMYSTSELFGSRVTGGLKRFLELYYGLISRGYKVELYSADNRNTLKANGIDGHTLKSVDAKGSVLLPAEVNIMIKNFNLIKKIKKDSFDKVIVFDVPTAFSLSIVGIKNIQLFIRQDLLEYKNISLSNRCNSKLLISIYLKLLKYIELFCLLRAEKIIVQCKYDVNKLISRHKIFAKKITSKTHVKINNVNPSWIVKNSRNQNKDAHISLEQINSRFTISFVGDFNNDRKGQRIFIDAIKDLVSKGYNVSTLVMGDGKQLERYIEECKSYKNIHFLGRVNNPIKIMEKSNLLVVPSLADSCPNTVMEALYIGVPVIGSLSGGIPEILTNKASLFAPNSMDLEQKIIKLMDSDELEYIMEQQVIRKNELIFNWADDIITIINI
ncbi:MAG: glycosyltransferase family 4 protein [bacterium]